MQEKEIVKKIIDNWDPIGLFPHAPNNEYWSEIDAITLQLSKTKNKEMLAKSIYDIFVNSFNEDIFHRDYDECLNIADKILTAIIL
jgi:Domain of unknown function (DUF1871).